MPYLTNQPWKETEAYFAEHDAVLIAVGAIHGHDHIPQGIDILAPEHMIKLIEEQTHVLVPPSIPYGPMENYMGYPGCISPSVDVFFRYTLGVVEDLMRWGAKRFYFMNGHSGNSFVLHEIAYKIRQRGGLGVILEWWRLLAHIDPELNEAVNRLPKHAPEGKRSRTRGIETAAAAAIVPGWWQGSDSAQIISSKELFPNSPFETNFATGVWFRNVLVPMRFGSLETTEIGEPGTEATVEMGEKIIAACVDFIAGFIDEMNRVDVPEFGG